MSIETKSITHVAFATRKLTASWGISGEKSPDEMNNCFWAADVTFLHQTSLISSYITWIKQQMCSGNEHVLQGFLLNRRHLTCLHVYCLVWLDILHLLQLCWEIRIWNGKLQKNQASRILNALDNYPLTTRLCQAYVFSFHLI